MCIDALSVGFGLLHWHFSSVDPVSLRGRDRHNDITIVGLAAELVRPVRQTIEALLRGRVVAQTHR